MSLIQLEQAARTYRMVGGEVRALGPTDLTIEAGEFVLVLGPSGSGKTTLVNLIAGIDSPTAGRVVVAGVDLTRLDRRGLVEYRRRHVGVVFQFHNLIPNLTARENVEMVADLTGSRGSADEVLDAVGLSARADHFPHELSGGEQQRVAIARALVKEPALVLGDEPTGNLDAATGKKILKLFRQINARGVCVLLVTHNSTLARIATRVLHVRDGEIRSDEPNPAPLDPEEIEW